MGHSPNARVRWSWLGEGPELHCYMSGISPQLCNLVCLIHVLGHPAHLEVVNQRPILGHIGHTPHDYCALTRLIDLWPIMQMSATGLSGTVSLVEVVALVTKYRGGCLIVLPSPCTWPLIQ